MALLITSRKSSQPTHATSVLTVQACTAVVVTMLCTGCIFFKTYKRDSRAPAAVQEYLHAQMSDVPKSLGVVLSIGPGAMPELNEAFGPSASVDEKTRVLHAAASIAKPAPLLEAILRRGVSDSDPSVRQVAAFRCGQFPSLAATLSPALRELLRDEFAPVRSAAFSSLGSFSPPHTLVNDELIRGMRDADFGVAAQAAAIAAKRTDEELLKEAQQALVNLLTALEDPSPATRAAVVFAFGQFSKKAAPVVQPLAIFMQREQVPEVKLQAALALVRIGTPAAKRAAIPTLRAFAKSRNPILKNTANDGLALAEGKKSS